MVNEVSAQGKGFAAFSKGYRILRLAPCRYKGQKNPNAFPLGFQQDRSISQASEMRPAQKPCKRLQRKNCASRPARSGDAFDAFIKPELVKWGQIVEKAGIKAP